MPTTPPANGEGNENPPAYPDFALYRVRVLFSGVCAPQAQSDFVECDRIRINSSGGLSTGFEARVCVACDPAPCAVACPTGAYEQRPGGGVKVHEELCIRCGECAKACPFDAIALDPENNFPYVCVHCALCVAFCPHDCLEMVDLEPRGTGSNLEETRHVA